MHLPSDNSLKYCVFKHFWKIGKFVTAGDAFGADFLIYPGDPMLYHASHLLILLNDASIKPLDLITKTRLAVTVNKICVFAYFKPKTDSNSEQELRFQTIQWEGNREKALKSAT